MVQDAIADNYDEPHHDPKNDKEDQGSTDSESEMSLFEERGTKTEDKPKPEDDKEPKPEPKTKPKPAPKRTRKTGVDRDVAEKVRWFVINSSESVAVRKMMSRLGVGEKLVSAIYAELKRDGYLMQTETGRWQRTAKCSPEVSK